MTGCVIVKDPACPGNHAVIHYGQDGGGEHNGTLWLVHDTIVELEALSASSLAHAKKAIYAWDAVHFDKGLARAEKVYMEELMRTEDEPEGIRAFMEKRPAVWRGK